MNRHYQSVSEDGEEMFTTLPLSFGGSYFADGTKAFFAPKMTEPYAVLDTPSWSTIERASFSFTLEGSLKGKRYTSADGTHYVYVGYYAGVDETLQCEGVACAANYLSQNGYVYKYKLPTGSTINPDDSYGELVAYSDMNGQKCLVPTITRYKVLYFTCETTETLPDILSEMSDFSEGGACSDYCYSSTTSSALARGYADELIQKTLPAIRGVSIPGSGIYSLKASSPAPSETIGGCRLAALPGGSYSARGQYPTQQLGTTWSFPTVALACVTSGYSGLYAFIAGCDSEGAPNIVASSYAGAHILACTGGNLSLSGATYIPAIPPISTYTPRASYIATDTGILWATVWRRIKSFSVQDDFTFWITS